jgi:two-component system CheB/CheR fusion protein
MRLNTRLLDLSLVIASAIESVQLSAEAKGIQLVSRLAEATVIGDVDRLQQVLWNLLSNAIKFTPFGGRVDITLEPVGDQAQIRVSDTGQGIEADLLPYIFDRFRQGDSSSTKDNQGLGIGLSIVRHLVELHGGTVAAQSLGEGQGSTIIIKLPLRVLPQEDILPTDSAQVAIEESRNRSVTEAPMLNGVSILVVEDEIGNRELIQLMLEALGAEVVAVSSARDTIAVLAENPSRYDVLLADLAMPGEDGLSLIRRIRALDAAAGGQILAIAITAYVNDQMRQAAIGAGFQFYITKPINEIELAVAISTLHNP